MKSFSILIFSTFLFSQSYAAELTTEQKLGDLRQLQHMVASSYGPRDYKKQALGIDYEVLARQYDDLVSKSTSNAEFYYLINRYVAEFKDSHFSSRLPSTAISTLGFTTELVDGKVLIDTIALPKDKFPFERGDEVLTVNGVSANDVIDSLKIYIGNGYDLTTRHIASFYVAYRPGRVVPIQRGEATVTIRRGSNVVETVVLPWVVKGEVLDEEIAPLMAKNSLKTFELSVQSEMKNFMGPNMEKSYMCSGTTRIDIPAGAVMVMQKPFVAYYYPTEKGNVGYLRIPHYSPVNEVTGEEEGKLRFQQYEYAVSVLEKNTVALVIDQQHNCGGSVDWLENVLGLFMKQDYDNQTFSFMATKAEYLKFAGWLTEVSPDTLEYDSFSKVVNLIKDTWTKGSRMTERTSFWGYEKRKPNNIAYTKPIMVLIDHLSGSGGDAFPSLIQGYGRAKLLGTRTMGAGGHVEAMPPLNYSGMSIRLTKSLFFRPDGVPVENNGAVPDINYEISRDDFLYGYKNLRAFYTEKVLELVN